MKYRYIIRIIVCVYIYIYTHIFFETFPTQLFSLFFIRASSTRDAGSVFSLLLSIRQQKFLYTRSFIPVCVCLLENRSVRNVASMANERDL